jgi:hypothetical protein
MELGAIGGYEQSWVQLARKLGQKTQSRAVFLGSLILAIFLLDVVFSDIFPPAARLEILAPHPMYTDKPQDHVPMVMTALSIALI